MNEQDFFKKVGATVTRLRKAKGWTVQEFADMVDKDKSNLISLEKGRENITLATLLKLAKALGVQPKDLLNF